MKNAIMFQNYLMFLLFITQLLLYRTPTVSAVINPKFAPYFDVTLGQPDLVAASEATGQLDFTLAFVLGGFGENGCNPTWATQFNLTDPLILGPIQQLQARGAQMVIATGGAVGNYLEHRCLTKEQLAAAYKLALDTVGTTHLDIDVEAPINLDIVNGALKIVQTQQPHISVSYTLMVQGEDYGIIEELGVKVLKSAKEHGVRVDLVNAMTMEYPSSQPSWGDAVILAANATLGQLRTIYPEKTEQEIRKLLGVTPMLGRNVNGKKFELEHAHQLVEWANENEIGYLSFWSFSRDNGGCMDVVSPYCSGIIQDEFEFTKIFQNFHG